MEDRRSYKAFVVANRIRVKIYRRYPDFSVSLAYSTSLLQVPAKLDELCIKKTLIYTTLIVLSVKGALHSVA